MRRPARRPVTRIAFAALGALAAAGCADAPRERPNVVVVVIDTLRADRLAAYGHPQDTTPFLTGLAERSVVFDRAWSTSSWTAPSTASLFTGLLPSQHGVLTGLSLSRRNKVLGEVLQGIEEVRDQLRPTLLNRIPTELVTLPELFAAEGYRTYGVADNPNLCEEEGFADGFGRFSPSDYTDAGQVVDRALAWKDELRSDDAPFFLYVHLMDPHAPYHDRGAAFDLSDVPADERALAESLILDPCNRCQGDRAFSPVVADKIAADDERFEHWQREIATAFYDSELTYLDREVERLFREADLERDSIVVVLSDHGEELGERGSYGHGFQLYEELVRVPLWIHVPGDDAPRGRRASPASLVDVLPTMCELVGAAEPGHPLAGRSLVPVLDEGDSDVGRPLVAQRVLERPVRRVDKRAIYQAGDKLIVNSDEPDAQRELYDLANDPAESVDLGPDAAGRVAELEALLESVESAVTPTERELVEFDLTPEIQESLRQLGYAGDDEPR